MSNGINSNDGDYVGSNITNIVVNINVTPPSSPTPSPRSYSPPPSQEKQDEYTEIIYDEWSKLNYS